MAIRLPVAVMLATALPLFGCGSAPSPSLPASRYTPPEAGPVCTEISCPIGYVATPALLTVGEELQREFDRCLASTASPDCARQAFAVVRKSQGLDQPTATGTVTVRRVPADTTPAPADTPPEPEPTDKTPL